MTNGPDRRLLIALGAVAAVAVLFFVVVQPLFFAEDDDLSVPIPPRPTPTAPPDVALPDEPGVPETFEVFTARDPFQQLVRPVVDAGPGQPADPTDPTAPPTGPTDPDAPPPDVQVGATTVILMDVFTDDDGVGHVIVDVNGTVHTVAEGEMFAESFRVLDITGQCATFLFGDSRFSLCVGEEIRK